MTFTVRQSEEEQKIIDEVKALLNLNANSKAVIAACSEVLKMKKEIDNLKGELYNTQQRLKKADKTLAAIKTAQELLSKY